MPFLTNPRHEAFAQAYVRGVTAGRRGASYRAAGYDIDDAGACRCAWRLLRDPRVARRIDELRRDHAAGRAGQAHQTNLSVAARGDPMSPLGNPRHEAFARAFVAGETAGNRQLSYLAAGYGCAARSAKAAASQLAKNPQVMRRIAELQQEQQAQDRQASERAIARLAVSKETVLNELARIAFANMLDYLRPAPDGGVDVDLARVDRDMGAAIQEVVVTPVRAAAADAPPVRRIRLKLADKRGALVDLGRHLGLFAERRGAANDYADMSEEQLAARVRDIFGELRRTGFDVRTLFGDAAEAPPARPN